MQNKPTVSAWPAKGSRHGPHFWPLLWPLQVRSPQRERKSRRGGGGSSPFPAYSSACVEDRADQLSPTTWGNAASLSVPWKRFSTEQVTAPPYFLHTIVSRVPALPSALAPACPHLRTCVRGVSVVRSSELLLFFFFDMPENASVCAAQRWPQEFWLCE